MPPTKVFKGQVFALSGKLSQTRKEHEDMIRSSGGEVVGSVTEDVTYLITNEADAEARSLKVATAIGRGTPIVHEGFLGACIAAKKLLDARHFAVLAARPKRKAPAKRAGGGEPAPKRAKAEVGPPRTTDKVAVIAKSGLADRAKVVQETVKTGFVEASLTWDVELVHNDVAAGKDKFYNMQVLASNEGGEYWAVQHYGKTGLDGKVHVDGPFDDIGDAKRVFRRRFRQRTGNVFGQLGVSFAEVAGKYRVLANDDAVAEAAAKEGRPAPVKAGGGKWQYYLHNKVDGKKLGWYDYEKKAGENMEKYFGQFTRDAALNVRLIQSDYFKYEVDFSAMIQRNVKSGMRRNIRRIAEGERAPPVPPKKIPAPAEPAPDWKGAESSEEDEEDESSEDEGEAEVEAEEEAEAAPAEKPARAAAPAGVRGRGAADPAPPAGVGGGRAAAAAPGDRAPPEGRAAAPAAAGGRAPPGRTAAAKVDTELPTRGASTE